MKSTIVAQNAHVRAFNKLQSALPVEVTDRWLRMVETWETDPTQPNPFQTNRPSQCLGLRRLTHTLTPLSIVTSLSMTKGELAREDAEAIETGAISALNENLTSSAMLVVGIELEDSQ